jgi:peptidoglycan/LPS O-acetylase OafA/YrhL
MRQRLGYLDSLRGIAASIVALGHFTIFYVNFFIQMHYAKMPLFNRILLSPLVIIVDCDTGVCLFFVLSGFVLSKVFAAHLGAPMATLAGRAVRLFVPGLCACTYGFVLYVTTVHFVPDEPGSQFLGHWAAFFKDAFVNMPLLGYAGLSVFDRAPILSPYLADQLAGANPPLWSLSVEWQGSLLIFALIALRQFRPRLWIITMLLLSLMFLRDWFVCFLFGHLLAVGTQDRKTINLGPGMRCLVAGASLAFGIFICGLAAEHFVGPFRALLASDIAIPSTNDAQDAERLYAAIFIFAGIFGLTELHRSLEHPALAWLGRMSFPIYLTHYPIVVWIVPMMFKEFPSWFWVPDASSFAISAQLEYPRALIAAFLAAIVLTLAAATCFLAIDRFAISSGHKLRTYLAERRAAKTGSPRPSQTEQPN